MTGILKDWKPCKKSAWVRKKFGIMENEENKKPNSDETGSEEGKEQEDKEKDNPEADKE